MLIRKLLLVWMIAWLPVAGVMAAVMPLSAMTTKMHTAVVLAVEGSANISATERDDEFVMPCHVKKPAMQGTNDGSCTHCDLCHLAGALVMCDVPVMPKVLPRYCFTAMPLFFHPSFEPELLAPPPRSSLA